MAQNIKTNNNVDYHMHSRIWLPDDLQAGDIIKCKMLTKYNGLEEPEMCPRTAMVLGFELDPESLEYTSLHVARFSTNPVYCRDETNFFVPRYMERKGLVSGVETPSTLKTDRTDFLPLDFYHFGDTVERLGSVSPALFDDIRDSLSAGNKNAPNSVSRYHGRNKGQWYVPSMHQVGEDVPAMHPDTCFSELSEIDEARISMDLIMQKDPQKLDGAYVTQCILDFNRACKQYQKQLQYEALAAKKTARFGAGESRKEVAAKLGRLKSRINDLESAGEDMAAVEISPDEKLWLSIPNMDMQKLADLHELVEVFNKREPANTKVCLPKHLWQGRYLMLRLPNVGRNSDSDGQEHENSYRPCAVWKAYADKDTGELAGLELHPVTRGYADEFDYKFQVFPVKTRSKNPSYLLADCIVRVPLEGKYFHEDSQPGFFELPPEKLAKFAAKRDVALESTAPHIVGLKDVPDNWEEVELDPVPSFSQFVKWQKKGQISFDGKINENKKTRQRCHKYKKDNLKPE